MSSVTIADLVRNGTMNAEMAAVLWAAVDERLSFLTCALPRLAGKSTTSNAVLALRTEEVPARYVYGEPREMEKLQEERQGGYLVVNEFSQAPMPGYIWGQPVRRVFATLPSGYSIQASLHADSVEEAIDVVCRGNGVSDEDASNFKLVLYIQRFGMGMSDYWRRLVSLYELHRVEGGKPIGHPLFTWDRSTDSFQQVSAPHQFGKDADDLRRRAEVIQTLAANPTSSVHDVQDAVRRFHAS